MKPLIKWNPFTELSSFRRDVDDLFTHFFERSGGWMPGMLRERFFPALESFYKEGKFVVRAELPGIDPKDVDISIMGNQLTIKGERKSEKDIKEDDYIMMERSLGSFIRTITLPEGVDSTKVHAGYHEGILDISMPCAEAAAPKKIIVEIEGAEEKIVKKAA
ncbi:MAG: Hsp20/alpha crystallin family protein [Nitrospirae bacterium]|nr:Hsp20/alpha crystallin family protein [Nitrospirota bacterium]